MGRLRRNALRAFARDTRASAGIELGIGAVVLLSVAGLCFDLYARVEADTVGARLAVTMADYVSRGPDTDEGTLDGDALKALGAFLHARELDVPADLVFVVSALRQPSGTPTPAVEVLWSDDTIRFGNEAVTDGLAAGCSRFVTGSDGSESAALPSGLTPGDFTMAAGEVLVVAEVCMRLTREGSFTAGDIYRHHALPARVRGLPKPVHTAVAGA